MADELADEDLVDYEEEVEEGDDKPTEEVKKYAAATCCWPAGSRAAGGTSLRA